MADNEELITKGLKIVRRVLVPYVVSELKNAYGDRWWQEGVYAILYNDRRQDYPERGTDEELRAKMDILLTLRTIDQNWQYFKKRLPPEYRSWVNETINARHSWAHQGEEGFTDTRAARALETMSLLCHPIDADAESELAALVRTARYGSEQGSVAAAPKKAVIKIKRAAPAEGASGAPSGALKSWRDVIWPHPDVAEGMYKNAEFAADLSQVVSGKAAFEYRDPIEFFARTYITSGMQSLLVQALQRISGKGGEPVVQLKTAFGGGKTHTMLALYHLFGGRVTAESVPALKPIVEKAGLASIPRANIVVLVGTALSKSASRRPADMPGISVSTLWGEMAYQLAKSTGDASLYDIIKEADKKGVNPGSNSLVELFEKSGPTLILIDELVAYGRELYDKTNLPAGSYASFISFIQSLTEAADASAGCMVIAAIPESNMEIGGEYGQRTLEDISHHFGRKEALWKPVEASEGFEVVRRRLFMECQDAAARDAVCEAFFKMYQENAQQFPIDCRQPEYLERMKQCYPIHPEVFDRLYGDWATLEKFQRTRGVLRLMAAVIKNLWESTSADLLILPSSIPIQAPFVKEELLRYLGDPWSAIIDGEVDGKKSEPFKIDAREPRFGSTHACVSVARTVFFGSAPSVRTNNRGITLNQINLGCSEPADKIHIYTDALNTLCATLSYLYSGYGNYWFYIRPTIRKMMEEKAALIGDDEANELIRERIRALPKGRVLKRVHFCVQHSSDVADEQEVRLVVIDHTCSYSEHDSAARDKIADILDHVGDNPRMHKNMLLFCVADRRRVSPVTDDAKKLIAWKQIDRDKDDLELSNADKRTIKESIDQLNEAIETKINVSYSWICKPMLSPENPKDYAIDLVMIQSKDAVMKVCEDKFLSEEAVITKFSAKRLMFELDSHIWKNIEDDYIEIKTLWKDFTSYLYFARLQNYSVLEGAILDGLRSRAYFAIADDFTQDGYVNLRWGDDESSLNVESLLVKKQAAEAILGKQAAEEEPQGGGAQPPEPQAGEGTTRLPSPFRISSGSSSPPPAGVTEYTSFFLAAQIELRRYTKDAFAIYDKIIDILQNVPQSNVRVSIEVHADFAKNTLDAATKDSVQKACDELNFNNYGFE